MIPGAEVLVLGLSHIIDRCIVKMHYFIEKNIETIGMEQMLNEKPNWTDKDSRILVSLDRMYIERERERERERESINYQKWMLHVNFILSKKGTTCKKLKKLS